MGALGRAGLGYPALAPLIQKLVRSDDLVYARFYSAPYDVEPFKSEWIAMQSANRHVTGLEFFQGYRSSNGSEKIIDVALAVDLIRGIADGEFDRVDVVGGDGDLLYAIKAGHEKIGSRLRVHLAPGQRLSALGPAHVAFTAWTVAELTQIGAADLGERSRVPAAATAPAGSPWAAKIRKGSFGTLSPTP